MSQSSLREPMVTYADVYAPNKKHNYGGNDKSCYNDIWDTCEFILMTISSIFCCCFNN
jgi:hypothetical protein